MSQRAVWWAVTVNCVDPSRVAAFWGELLDCLVLELGSDRPGWFRLEPLGSSGPFLNFQPVQGPRSAASPVHLDVLVDDLDAAADRVVRLDGSDTGRRQDLPRGRIAVMRDPEGHEFCLLAPPRP